MLEETKSIYISRKEILNYFGRHDIAEILLKAALQLKF
jgi:hypothetical protein